MRRPREPPGPITPGARCSGATVQRVTNVSHNINVTAYGSPPARGRRRGCVAFVAAFRFECQTADTRPHSRGGMSPSFACRRPSKEEGAGNAGCALHPRSRVQRVERKLHTSIQGSGGDPTFPAQWLYGLYRAHPGVSGFLASVAFRKPALRPGRAFAPPKDLTPTTEASDPRDFAVRFDTARQHVL